MITQASQFSLILQSLVGKEGLMIYKENSFMHRIEKVIIMSVNEDYIVVKNLFEKDEKVDPVHKILISNIETFSFNTESHSLIDSSVSSNSSSYLFQYLHQKVEISHTSLISIGKIQYVGNDFIELFSTMEDYYKDANTIEFLAINCINSVYLY